MCTSRFLRTLHDASVVYIYRKQHTTGPSVGTVDVPVNVTQLKHGFQWLKEQNTVDVIVDATTNASFLEHLVFKYDFTAKYLSL